MQLLKNLFAIVLIIGMTFAAKAQTPGTVKPYSNYRSYNGVVYVSGQIGVSPVTGKLVNADFEVEVKRVMQNIQTVLTSAGTDMKSVLSVTVYLKDMNQYAEFNRIYLQYFEQPYPARAAVAVKELALGASLEVAVIAAENKK